MTTLTPNFSLPYPDATDAPCDFAEQWCAFTDAIEAVTTGFESTVARTIPAIPVAVLLVTSPITVATGSAVPFDTIAADTAGWVDFDESLTTVHVDRAGRYWVVATVTVGTTTVLNNYVNVTLEGVLSRTDTSVDRTAGLNISMSVGGMALVNTTAGTDFQMTVGGEGATVSIDVQQASFAVFWHADGASP